MFAGCILKRKIGGILYSLEKKEDKEMLEKSLLGPNALEKRWHGLPPIDELFSTPWKPGKIIDRRPKGLSYDPRIRSNYVNCPYNTEMMYFGTTHVAIGFNDLNSLINSAWQPAKSLVPAKEAAYRDGPKGRH